MKLVQRYARLYWNFIRFSCAQASAFRAEFWMRIFMDIFYYGAAIGFYKILFYQTGELVGWNEQEALLFVGLYLLLDAIQMVCIATNSWWFPALIHRGDLDYYLVRPVSTLFFVSLRDVGVASVINVLLALGIVAWAISNLPQPVSIGQLVVSMILLVNGTFLFYCLRWLSIVPVFWSQAGRGLDNVFWQMNDLMQRPDAIYHGVFRIVLVTVIPFALMASFPARIAIEGISWGIILHALCASVWMFGILLWIWKRGLKIYSSASS
jgi:ABC-2 type transport system permease protein